jgi:hypothetical protein
VNGGFDPSGVKLGKKGVTYYADAPLKLSDYYKGGAEELLDATLEALPPTPESWSEGMFHGQQMPSSEIPMFGNDQHGDCTCATQGHSEVFNTYKVTGAPETLPEQSILDLYYETGKDEGLDPEDGRYLWRVIDYRRRLGIKQTDGTYEKILGGAAVDVTNWDEVVAAGYLFGGLQVGIGLPQTAAYQIQNGLAWDYVSVPGYSSAPGSWGGHATYVTARKLDGTGVLATWARRQRWTRSFWEHYVDEGYVLVSPDWASEERKSPSGFYASELVRDLGEL